MANKKEEKTTAVAEVPKPGALAVIPEDMIRDEGKGVEAIGAEDVKPARLRICQAGSPQRKTDDPKQIQGLNELDMFNDLSGENYGRGPLRFCVIKSLGSRHMEFAPMEEGGGVIDFDVKAGDPRTLFTVDEASGKRVKPIATKFYDYLVWLPDTYEIVAWSLKSTMLKLALQLNGIMKYPVKIDGVLQMKPSAWARTFSLTTKMEKNAAAQSWGVYVLRTDGLTPVDVRDQCSALFDAYATKNITIDHTDDVHDGPDPDGPDAEREPVAGEM